MHPNVKLVLQKFDRELLAEYADLHAKWYNGRFDYQKQKFLHDNVDILQTLWPLKNIPEVIYRGMRMNQKKPEKNRPIFYSNKRSFVSSWSSDKEIPVKGGFCEHYGIMLTMLTRVMKGKAKFVLWPIPVKIVLEFYKKVWNIYDPYEQDLHGGYPEYASQQEYVVWINKTIPIAPPGKIEDCSSY